MTWIFTPMHPIKKELKELGLSNVLSQVFHTVHPIKKELKDVVDDEGLALKRCQGIQLRRN